MTTIVDFRSKARALYGTDPTTDRGFVDTVLDNSIKQAVMEFSQYVPRRLSTFMGINGGVRAFLMSDLGSLVMRVVAVEYPLNRWPRSLLEFDVWGDTVTLDHSPPSTVYSVRVYYHEQHLVDGSGSTIAAQHEYLIAEGAFIYSLFGRTIGMANTFDVSGTNQQANTMPHLRVAQERLDHWRRQLAKIGNELRTAAMYAPGSRIAAKTVVGPI